MNKQEVLDAALLYARRGWAVIPLFTVDDDGRCNCAKAGKCMDAGKHPAVGSGVSAATKDEAIINKWFAIDGEARNVGIATGKISGLTVLDIDIGLGKLGAESWAAAIEAGGEGEPVTLTANTGSGGMHFFFKYNSAVKTASNWLGAGVDSRNDKGYVVAAPSRHRSGGYYTWVDLDTDLADLPASMATRVENRGRKKGSSGRRYTVEEFKGMLAFIPSDDRDLWIKMGIIAGREFNRSSDAWDAYVEWSAKAGGVKGRNHDEIMLEAFNVTSQKGGEKEASMGTVVALAIQGGWVPRQTDLTPDAFVYYAPGNNFIYRPTMANWLGAAVDAIVSKVNENGVLKLASDWIQEHWPVTSMTSDPDIAEEYIKGQDCCFGEMQEAKGARCLNIYRRPTIELGDARLAQPFVEHLKLLMPNEGDDVQFLNYMAHRVQHPGQKPRFALLIAGEQGVGKDTAIEFCVPAIGAWNVANIEPAALNESFNEYVESTLVRISETSNVHEMNKWAFNEQSKVLIAGLPDIVWMNSKYGSKRMIKMRCGVLLTTNNLDTGIYIPADDRRYDVMQCATRAQMGLSDDKVWKDYFTRLWTWFWDEDGAEHIAAFLTERDLSTFSANSGQRKTSAHKRTVTINKQTDEWCDDALVALDYPEVIRGDVILKSVVARGEKEMDARRKLIGAMERLGYRFLHCPTAKDGRWSWNKKKYTLYARVPEPKIDETVFVEEF